MEVYLREKHDKQKHTGELPQVIGLTASPGAGGANSVDDAVQHVLSLCANLDAEEFVVVREGTHRASLGRMVVQPVGGITFDSHVDNGEC